LLPITVLRNAHLEELMKSVRINISPPRKVFTELSKEAEHLHNKEKTRSSVDALSYINTTCHLFSLFGQSQN